LDSVSRASSTGDTRGKCANKRRINEGEM